MKTRFVSAIKRSNSSFWNTHSIANAHPQAPSSAFLTMMVQNSDFDDNAYSPGDRDPYTGQLLMDALEAAVYMAPAGSPARENLQRNFDHWYETVREMDGTRDWWQVVPRTSGNLNGVDLIDPMIIPTFACRKRTEWVRLLPRACSQPGNAGSSIARSEA